MALMIIEEPRKPGQHKSMLADHPLWRLGFRPFYLLAALFAAISVPLWMAQYFGGLRGLPNVGVLAYA